MIVLSGASASGKTEVAKLLAKKYGIVKIITTTTREQRLGEENGRDYFFVSKDEFEKMIEEDKFVEYTVYNGQFYGSTKDQINDNKCVVIDPAGLRSYIALKNKNIITIFLDAEEKTRYARMLFRGDSIEKAKERISHDRVVFSPNIIPDVDYHLDSETKNVEQVCDEIYQIYQLEMRKRKNR